MRLVLLVNCNIFFYHSGRYGVWCGTAEQGMQHTRCGTAQLWDWFSMAVSCKVLLECSDCQRSEPNGHESVDAHQRLKAEVPIQPKYNQTTWNPMAPFINVDIRV